MRVAPPSSSDASGRGTPWRRSPSAAAAPRAVGGGARAGAGGRGVGRARATPAPEPSLGLASHVNLERLVSGLLQNCKRGGVLVIADGGNPAVGCPEVRSGRKEGRDVGNELPREGPCRWHRWGGWRCGNHRVDMLDRLLDKIRVVAGEFEGAEALAGVKILEDVQEELVEQSVLLYRDEEGQAFGVILGRDAVHRVVLLEVEQAA